MSSVPAIIRFGHGSGFANPLGFALLVVLLICAYLFLKKGRP